MTIKCDMIFFQFHTVSHKHFEMGSQIEGKSMNHVQKLKRKVYNIPFFELGKNLR